LALLILALAAPLVGPCLMANAAVDEIKEWPLPDSETTDLETMGIALNGSFVYFVEYQGNVIGRLDPLTDALTEWPDGGYPVDIVVNSSLLYLTEWASSIASLNPLTNDLTRWAVPDDPSYPDELTLNGTYLYWTEFYNDKVGRLNPKTNTMIRWNVTAGAAPEGIVVNGSFVYFTENYGYRIGRLDTAANILTEWDSGTAHAPYGIVCNGSVLYFTASGKIGRLNPKTNMLTTWNVPTPTSGPGGIVVDGRYLYFTELFGNKIGRLDPSIDGTSTSITPSTPKTVPTTTTPTPQLLKIIPLTTILEPTYAVTIPSINPPFTEWPITSSGPSPHGPGPYEIAVGIGSPVYFTERYYGRIGLLTYLGPQFAVGGEVLQADGLGLLSSFTVPMLSVIVATAAIVVLTKRRRHSYTDPHL